MRNNEKYTIYCAGPLFNNKEKEEMNEIANILNDRSFCVFLPHKDGFEYANLLNTIKKDVGEIKAKKILSKAIFMLDVYKVIRCDGLILNINGRVPDEGALVEAGIAWSAGKKVVIYKNDNRSLIDGDDNPLILGLTNFVTTKEIEKIPEAFELLFSGNQNVKAKESNDFVYREVYTIGKELDEIKNSTIKSEDLCRKILNLLG